MRTHTLFAYGTAVSVYAADSGEGLTWHWHAAPHGHKVVRGRTLLEVEGEASVEVRAGDGAVGWAKARLRAVPTRGHASLCPPYEFPHLATQFHRGLGLSVAG